MCGDEGGLQRGHIRYMGKYGIQMLTNGGIINAHHKDTHVAGIFQYYLVLVAFIV